MFLPDLSFAPEPTRPSPPQDLMDSVEAPTEPRARVGASVPRVLIYHTHSSEMYLGPTAASTGYRNSHLEFSSTNDRAVTGIMQVGRHLAATLSQLGIPVLHDSRIHDYGGLKYSYFNSERTVSEHLQRYPDLELVIDLHRDAGVPEPVTTVNGQRVARVLLVLGTAQDIPQSHPNWQANVAFAQRLFSTAQQMYPGLMRPTQIRRDARYNQHLHPNSLIIEVGSVENTLEEAMLAAEYVARVLANLL